MSNNRPTQTHERQTDRKKERKKEIERKKRRKKERSRISRFKQTVEESH